MECLIIRGGASGLHAAMTAGNKMDEGCYELLRIPGRTLSRFVGDYFGQPRRDLIVLSHQEKTK